MNVIHSKIRNRLSVRSVEAILQIRYGLVRAEKTCASYEPACRMLTRFYMNQTNAVEDEVEEAFDTVCGF